MYILTILCLKYVTRERTKELIAHKTYALQ